MILGDDDPITLKRACQEFGNGQFTVATLRAEMRRGNLETYRIGNRDFTTLRDLREMQQKCRASRKGRAFTLIKDEGNGLSETDRISSALAALNQTTKALKNSLPNTSVASTARRGAHRR
jgi:hypothetical protein